MTTTWQYVMDFLTDSQEISDPRMKRFLMKSPLEFIVIIFFYFSVVLVGPKLMQNRKPFLLTNILIIYNISQILANFYLFLQIVDILDNVNISCSPWAQEDNLVSRKILLGHYQYTLLKYFDLVETIFYILRKKWRQISFLHVYHHIGFLSAVWISGKYFPGGQGIFVALYNTFIHCIMYSYYLYTSLVSSQNLWWKKYITILQLIQHCLIFGSMFPVLVNKNCSYPKGLTGLFLFNVIVIIYLFAKFYKDNYLNSTKNNTKTL